MNLRAYPATKTRARAPASVGTLLLYSGTQARESLPAVKDYRAVKTSGYVPPSNTEAGYNAPESSDYTPIIDGYDVPGYTPTPGGYTPIPGGYTPPGKNGYTQPGGGGIVPPIRVKRNNEEETKKRKYATKAPGKIRKDYRNIFGTFEGAAARIAGQTGISKKSPKKVTKGHPLRTVGRTRTTKPKNQNHGTALNLLTGRKR